MLEGMAEERSEVKKPRSRGKLVRRSVGKTWGGEDIKESLSDLRLIMIERGNENGGQAAPRIRLLMLLKSGAAPNASAAQRKLGVSWPTVSRWLKTYAEGGVEALLDIGQGGRGGNPGLVAYVRQRRADGVEAKQIVNELARRGHNLSIWAIYNLAATRDRGWQCKTTQALDEALSSFAGSAQGEELGGWYSRTEDGEARHNTDLVMAVVEAGAGAIIDGRHQGLKARRSWGHPGSLGSHLTLRLGDGLVAQVEAASRPGESQNQTLRRLLEAGLIELGHPPETEKGWASRQSVAI